SNTTPDRDESVKDPGLEERAFLDAGLSVEIEGGVIVPFDFLLAPKDYKSKPQMPAKGINCCAIWESTAPKIIKSESLPIFGQPHYRTRESLNVSFEELVGEKALPKLLEVADSMDVYLSGWDGFL